MKPVTRKNWASQFTGQTGQHQDKHTGNGRAGFNINTAAPVPRRGFNPTSQSYTNRFAKTLHIARYVPIGEEFGIDGIVLQAFVYTPNTRLRMRANVFFEADANTGVDPTFGAQPTWNITSMVRHPESGRESALQQLYPFPSGDANLPDEFTVDSAGELLRLNIHLDNNQFKETFVPIGTSANCLLVVTWEPNVYIDPGDLKRYFEMCKVNYGVARNIQNVSIP